MKIATWLEHYSGGGVERVAVRLARDWVELGHEVAILASPVEEQLRASLPPEVEWVPHFGGRKTAPAAIGAVAPDVFFAREITIPPPPRGFACNWANAARRSCGKSRTI